MYKRQLEQLRVAGDIGAPLDARVDLFCPTPLASTLSQLGNELRFVFITSEARVHAESERPESAVAAGTETAPFWLTLARSEVEKCVRCWHRRSDVGCNSEHPGLCGRCVNNVAGSGETRVYV